MTHHVDGGFEINHPLRFLTFSLSGWYSSNSHFTINDIAKETLVDFYLFLYKPIYC